MSVIGASLRDTTIHCAAFVYYKQQTVTPKNVEFRFVLVRELPLEIQVVEKEYRDWKRDGEFRLCLKENAIKLVLTKQEVDTWEIVELTKPQITKEDVTGFKKGGIIPYCAFECRLLKEDARIFHKVNIIGAKSEDLFFHIRYAYTKPEGVEEKSKLKQLYTKFYYQLVEAVSDPDTCHSLTTQLHSTSLLSEEKKAMLSSSVASGRSFLKVLGVEKEPHLLTVLMEKMSAVKELQTLSEDMSDWLSGSKQGATDTQFTEKQAYYERIERQQLLADVERLTSDKADLVTRLKCYEEDLRRANELMKPTPTVDSAVQANYLAVAPDFLRGVEVCAETVLEVVGDKPQRVEWPGYGFYIDVPEGALPPGVTASVGIKVILTGQFKLPENRQLISAFYWVSSSEVFLKEVAINIQHCAVIENEEQCLNFRFIIAKCSQKELPYTFKEFEGLFNPYTQYATIKLKQFSILSTTAPCHTKLRCAAFMYYKQQTDTPKNADFHFVLVNNSPPQILEVQKKYQHWKEDDNFSICFKENAIKLDLKQQQEVYPWEIVAVTTSQISKEDVTEFKEGRIIPHCAFECRLLTKEARIFQKVDIIGATESLFFHIRYCYAEPAKVPSAVATPPVTPSMLPLPQPSSPTAGSKRAKSSKPDAGIILFKLKQHGFPSYEWIGLAIGLMMGGEVGKYSGLIGDHAKLTALVNDWTASVDMKGRWEAVVTATAISGQKMVAKKLAKDVGVPPPEDD